MNYEVFDLSLYWTALLYLSLLLASLYLVNSSKSSPMNRQQEQQPQPQPPQPRPPRKEKQPATPGGPRDARGGTARVRDASGRYSPRALPDGGRLGGYGGRADRGQARGQLRCPQRRSPTWSPLSKETEAEKEYEEEAAVVSVVAVAQARARARARRAAAARQRKESGSKPRPTRSFSGKTTRRRRSATLKPCECFRTPTPGRQQPPRPLRHPWCW